MRFFYPAMATAFFGSFLAGSAVAQTHAPLRTIDYRAMQVDDSSPSDVPYNGAPTPAPAPAYDGGAACDSCYSSSCCSTSSCCNTCNSCCEDECGGGHEPFMLTDCFTDACGNNCITDNGFFFNGYMQWGYQSDPDGAFTGNGPFVNQKEWGNFNLNQAYVYMGRNADGAANGIDIGGRFDAMYGVDGNEGQAFGNVDPGYWDFQNGYDHGIYEWALPQAYGEVAVGDLSVKVGHFYTIIGYEVVMSPNQFFLSRQLTFWNSEPFTHTGALASYNVTDDLTVMGGWVLGWDTGYYQYNGGSSFIGGFSWNIDEDVNLYYGMMAGNLGWRGDGVINSVILTANWTDRFWTVTQFDALNTNLQSNFNTSAGGFTANNSTGFINYAFYDLVDWLKFGVRGEWYKADGTSYYTCTGGFNFFPMPNLVIRPEIRGMWAPGNDTSAGGADSGLFSGQLFNQAVYGVDCILTF